MSGTILTTSEMGKPGASCVVPTLGAVVAVLTCIQTERVPISTLVGYPGFQIPGSPSTTLDPEIDQLDRSSQLCDAGVESS